MRTTLKRGMGRGAAVNGNGRAVLPPTTVSPVTLYRQPPPPRRSRWRLAGAVASWLVVALLTLATGLAGGVYLYAHEAVHDVQAHTPAVKIAQKRLDVPTAGKPATALVIGYDRRFTGVDAGQASRSDTIMLVRADPGTKSISMMSFPRDLVVDLYCPGGSTRRGRINQAFTNCGPKGTLETVKRATGLSVNYLITVNFRGFIKIVDRLGGVWLDVDRRYFNDSGEYSAINLQPGYQELNGYQALAFVRYRHTDSDIYRLARQQAFVKAFKDQVHSAYKPLKLLGLVKEITRNVEVGVGGGKALDLDTVLSYAFFAYDLPPGHFFQSNIEGLEENSSFDIFAPEERMREAVRRFANPDVASPEKATQVVLGGRPKSAAPAPRDTYVTVLNGNGVEGSATLAGGLLHERGYSITTPSSGTANAPSYDYFETKIYFDPAQRGAKAAARKVANLFGSADVARVPPAVEALGNNAMIVVVVGKTFLGSLAAAPVDQTPVKQPPSIAPGTDASLQLLRDRAKKVPFPLMVPTVIERTSVIDREQPVRLYRIDPDREHRALRLVFRTGASEYWGVQETDWTEAPILSERNVTRRVKGRRYELHYSGPKLHMIVLRTRHATYWVTNTLRDSLSNETMLAIAKGLKPIASLK
jgi:LCP family protein required for cell wall assembly